MGGLEDAGPGYNAPSPGADARINFLGTLNALESGERCAILSQDDPDDLLSHADYIGYDLRPGPPDGPWA